MVVMMDASTGSFGCLFLFNIMLFNIDVSVVINDCHPLREGGDGAFIKVLHESHVGRACNDCNGYMICI